MSDPTLPASKEMTTAEKLRDWANSNMRGVKYGPGLLRIAADEIEGLQMGQPPVVVVSTTHEPPPDYDEHDSGIIRDLEVMAADRLAGFWPQALAMGALRLIRQRRTQPPPDVLRDAERYRLLRAGNDYERKGPMVVLCEQEHVESDGRPFWSMAESALDEAVDTAMAASPSTKPPECAECEGSGESAVNHNDGTQSSTSDPPCHVCGGSGVAFTEGQGSRG